MYARLVLLALIVGFLLWQNWNVNAQGTQHRITVSWGAVTKDTAGTTIAVDGYNIYRGTVTGQTTTKLTGSPIAALSFADTSGTAGTPYFYAVTAVKGAFESAKSNEVSATFLANPANPVAVSAIAE